MEHMHANYRMERLVNDVLYINQLNAIDAYAYFKEMDEQNGFKRKMEPRKTTGSISINLASLQMELKFAPI